ncbi:MAG: hypothetical protein A2Z51_05205 [Deltaproteobacteria bacterium RBG_19FT_COMBO_52_11]|jgi:hypothetical protein|nr:MAG: hypothetical protein A2Z51_05205 [Deltaproteobacteria bacterium RBG_19FT_COMBO_52_11]
MPISGSPKKLANDVASGYQQFTHATLRQYNPEDLKALLFNLNIVLKGLRGQQIPQEDNEAIKEKNVKMRRLNQAINTIQSFSALRGTKV